MTAAIFQRFAPYFWGRGIIQVIYVDIVQREQL